MDVRIRLQKLTPHGIAADGILRRHAVIRLAYAGVLDGVSTLMLFADEPARRFVGLECISGRTGDRYGEWYVRHAGFIVASQYFSKAELVSAEDGGPLPGLGMRWDMAWHASASRVALRQARGVA